jgi:hypothetical protein
MRWLNPDLALLVLAERYELINSLEEIRQNYAEITSEFSALLNEIKAYMVRFVITANFSP